MNSSKEENYQPLEADLIQFSSTSQTLGEKQSDNMLMEPNPADIYLYNRLSEIQNQDPQVELPLASQQDYQKKSEQAMNDQQHHLNGFKDRESNYEARPNVKQVYHTAVSPVSGDFGHESASSSINSEKSQDMRIATQVNPAIHDPNVTADQPFYVNAKQYSRILKRRFARARLEEDLRISRERRPYLHESRHKHAMRRPRGQGGRFLTSAEIAALKEKESSKTNSDSSLNRTPTNKPITQVSENLPNGNIVHPN